MMMMMMMISYVIFLILTGDVNNEGLNHVLFMECTLKGFRQ